MRLTMLWKESEKLQRGILSLSTERVSKFVLQRFPFNVFYRPGPTEIEIIAVAHQKRRPGYWSNRADEELE